MLRLPNRLPHKCVFIADYIHKSCQHEDFNRGAIKSILTTCSVIRAYFISSSTSLTLFDQNNVCLLNDTSTLKARQIATIPILLMILSRFRSCIYATDVIFLQLLPLHYLLLSFYSILLGSNKRIIVCVHGELALLLRSELKSRLYAQMILLSLRLCSLPCLSVRFAFLEQRIYDNFIADYPKISCVDWVQHYVDKSFSTITRGDSKLVKQHKRPFAIGTIGIHSRSKQSHDIYAFAAHSSSDIYYLTCGLSDGTFGYTEGMVRHLFPKQLSDTYIATEVYISAIVENIDAVLLLHNDSSGYRYISSGIVYDLIWLRIPALCDNASPLMSYLSYFSVPLFSISFNDYLSSDPDDHSLINGLRESLSSQTITNEHLRQLSLERWAKVLS